MYPKDPCAVEDPVLEIINTRASSESFIESGAAPNAEFIIIVFFLFGYF